MTKFIAKNLSFDNKEQFEVVYPEEYDGYGSVKTDDLIIRYRNGENDLLNYLMYRFKSAVLKYANKYLYDTLADFSDLMMAGYYSIIESLNKCDLSKDRTDYYIINNIKFAIMSERQNFGGYEIEKEDIA